VRPALRRVVLVLDSPLSAVPLIIDFATGHLYKMDRVSCQISLVAEQQRRRPSTGTLRFRDYCPNDFGLRGLRCASSTVALSVCQAQSQQANLQSRPIAVAAADPIAQLTPLRDCKIRYDPIMA